MAAELPDVVQSHISRALSRLYTSIPAIITDVSKLETDNVVSVQPAIQKTTTDDFAYDMAEIPDVPIQWPAGGGAVLTFPLAVGDDILLVCSMTSIAEWWLTQSGTVRPFDSRSHDLSDSFVIPSIFRNSNNPSPSKDNVVLKYGDSSISLLKTGDISVETINGSHLIKQAGQHEFVVKETISVTNSTAELIDILNKLAQQMALITVSSFGAAPNNAAAITALQLQLASFVAPP